jgi:hypothetical protein
MGNKPSSVDILCQKLANKLGLQAITFYIDHAEEIAEAKAKHEEEIIKAVKYGFNREYFTPNFQDQQELFEQYYEQKYKEVTNESIQRRTINKLNVINENIH